MLVPGPEYALLEIAGRAAQDTWHARARQMSGGPFGLN